MSDFAYHVVGLIPSDPPFDVQHAVEMLRAEGYKAEPAPPGGAIGIRVVEDDGWAIVAWLDEDEDAREMNQDLSQEELPEGITPDQIADCVAQLSIWSDDDPELMNAHVFEEFIQVLKDRLGMFIFDNRLGVWR